MLALTENIIKWLSKHSHELSTIDYALDVDLVQSLNIPLTTQHKGEVNIGSSCADVVGALQKFSLKHRTETLRSLLQQALQDESFVQEIPEENIFKSN